LSERLVLVILHIPWEPAPENSSGVVESEAVRGARENIAVLGLILEQETLGVSLESKMMGF
jgi:hypothetical protein